MRWGLIPSWAKDIKTINARAGEVETKPAFREAFQRRRCLVARNLDRCAGAPADAKSPGSGPASQQKHHNDDQQHQAEASAIVMVRRAVIKTTTAEQKKQNNQKNDDPHRVSPVEAARNASFGCLVLTPADAQSPKKGSATGGAWRFRAY
jgi:hypothetical protein